MDEKILTPKELAFYLKMHPKTLARWRGAGIGPAWFRVNGKAVRYTEAAVDAWTKRAREAGGEGS